MKPKPDSEKESYKGYNRLEGRSALITGGDSEIGRATAIAYARGGANDANLSVVKTLKNTDTF